MSENINFKIISNKKEVYVEGYVTINDEEAEDVDWNYWTGNGYQSTPFYHHGKESINGRTKEQDNEIDEFIEDYRDDSLWIDTCILQSSEDENRTYVRENCTLIINEGAKMECEIKESLEYLGDYVVEVIPRFNGKEINLYDYMVEMNEIFDPWDENGFCLIQNGQIFFEISKDYYDDLKEDVLNDVNEEARRIFARSLTSYMGIYSIYGEVMEQCMDNDYDDEWLFKMNLHKDDSEEELDKFLREEGYIDEELDY